MKSVNETIRIASLLGGFGYLNGNTRIRRKADTRGKMSNNTTSEISDYENG
jgi:hypothetical protein